MTFDCMFTRPFTTLPLYFLIVDVRTHCLLALHTPETLDCFRDATVPFQDFANHPIYVKPRRLKLNQKECQYPVSDHDVTHTLAAAPSASFVEPRINTVLAHLISTVFG